MVITLKESAREPKGVQKYGFYRALSHLRFAFSSDKIRSKRVDRQAVCEEMAGRTTIIIRFITYPWVAVFA